MRRGRLLSNRARPRNSSAPSPAVYALIAVACLCMGFTASRRTQPALPGVSTLDRQLKPSTWIY
jgi:hypothetical protein